MEARRTVLVSDGGGQGLHDDPASDWRGMVRVMKVVDNQVRVLRKRQVIEGFKRGDRLDSISAYAATSATITYLTASPPLKEQTLRRRTSTRLASMKAVDQVAPDQLGDTRIRDTALRRHLVPDAREARGLPVSAFGPRLVVLRLTLNPSETALVDWNYPAPQDTVVFPERLTPVSEFKRPAPDSIQRRKGPRRSTSDYPTARRTPRDFRNDIAERETLRQDSNL